MRFSDAFNLSDDHHPWPLDHYWPDLKLVYFMGWWRSLGFLPLAYLLVGNWSTFCFWPWDKCSLIFRTCLTIFPHITCRSDCFIFWFYKKTVPCLSPKCSGVLGTLGSWTCQLLNTCWNQFRVCVSACWSTCWSNIVGNFGFPFVVLENVDGQVRIIGLKRLLLYWLSIGRHKEIKHRS